MSARVRKGDTVPGVERSAWSIKEFAATLGVNYNTVRRMVAREELRAVLVGGEYRIPDSELKRLLAPQK